MKVALDATYAAYPERTGTGVYSERLIAALAAAPQARLDAASRLILCFRLGPYLRWARKKKWPERCVISPLLDPWLPPPRAHLFHGLNQRLPERGKYAVRVVTVHDLFPLASDEYSTRQFQQHFTQIIQKAVSRADWIIAVSDATRRQLLRHTEAADGRIRVIHHGVDPAQPAAQADQDAFRERLLGLSKEEKFFLNVGTIQTRKNVASIAAAMKRLPEFRLVLAGGDGFGADRVHSLIEKEGLAGRILRLGHTVPQTLRLLYSAATALVFPSLEEGFGMPILEAMSYGLPVITSNCSSMPEVAGDAALFVDPGNVQEIGDAMRRVAEDPALAAALGERGKRRAGQFSWERCARETWEVYQEAVGGK
ncbi:MAG: glycosyltransferase family 1 protein [Acidobacteria bacterium]|nr:glycosyltransferase family 1 protein [Acidobacteriota bacterium]MCZ6752643.1 glycosyltransferase family 1 protein [Acidobacteriota bacterium]